MKNHLIQAYDFSKVICMIASENKTHNQSIKNNNYVTVPKSLYRSCAGSYFYGKNMRFGLMFGWLDSTISRCIIFVTAFLLKPSPSSH